jgi:hypothetical protein
MKQMLTKVRRGKVLTAQDSAITCLAKWSFTTLGWI